LTRRERWTIRLQATAICAAIIVAAYGLRLLAETIA
jgi:hypothetical protein